jgi:Icc-related predicted phosphoesterase
MMRVYALSDIHVDYEANRTWIYSLSSTDFQEDVLILAGDISYDLKKVRETLAHLQAKFKNVFFVPGNHDLWIRKSTFANSLEKFDRLMETCRSIGVHVSPAKIGREGARNSLWIVPLFSWYATPEKNGNSLFVPAGRIDLTRYIWADYYYTKWPPLERSVSVAEFFLQMNEVHLRTPYNAPVISFSHYLPRRELIFASDQESEKQSAALKRSRRLFNFSRVAGSTHLEKQIRQLGSYIHVYAHQHRNRHSLIDGVLYVSHCLGYPRERERGVIGFLENVPECIWDSEQIS